MIKKNIMLGEFPNGSRVFSNIQIKKSLIGCKSQALLEVLDPVTVPRINSFFNNPFMKKGKYLIKKKWSNNTLVNQLFLMRNLNLIDLYIPSAMNLEIILGKISSQVGLDSIKILEIFNDYNIQKNLGFNSYTFPSIIIPNTYEVFANISEQKLIDL